MAVAVYTTDLSVFDDAESATGWVEVTGYLSGGTPEDDTDYFIYGTTQCITQENRKTGLHSIAFAGTAVTLPTDGVFLIWEKFLAPNAMDTEANGGMRILVGSSSANFYGWKINGSDTYPYGGWVNLAIDPTIGSPDYTTGSPAGTYACMGIGLNLLVAISKGNPHGCDIIRYGRGESRYTVGDSSTPALFSGFAAANDAVTARWGLFQDVGGSYLFKGLMSLGLSATAVYMDDSNVVITIDNTKKVSSGFNAIEVHNSGSTVLWTSINVTSLCTVSKGTFEMVDNATLVFTGCVFTDMGTFLFLSNGDMINGTFRRCGQVTHGGGIFTGTIMEGYEGTADTAYLLYASATDPDGELDNMTFTKGTASTHAIQFDATNTPTTITLRGIDFNDYNATNGSTDSALFFPSTSKSYTVNLVNCTGDISYKVGTGGSVTLVVDPRTFSFTLSPSLIDYEWRLYSVTAVGSMVGSVELDGEEIATADNQSYAYTYSVDTPVAVQIINQPDNDYEESITYYTLGDADQDITILLKKDNNN